MTARSASHPPPKIITKPLGDKRGYCVFFTQSFAKPSVMEPTVFDILPSKRVALETFFRTFYVFC